VSAVDWADLELEYARYALARARAVLDERERLEWMGDRFGPRAAVRIAELSDEFDALMLSRPRTYDA